MKRMIQKNAFLFFLLLLGTQLMAQNSHVRSQGYWTLGLNGGWAYQQSDAKASYDGYGVGLTLAKNMYYRAGAPLTFDLRGRLLYANTYGLDGSRSFGIANNTAINGTKELDYLADPGFVYYNHNTKIGELALEGVIHLNRLREQSHFDISLFGGIGLDYYNTKNNFLGANGSYASDFASVDVNGGVNANRDQVLNILDTSYETPADGFGNGTGKIEIMPSLGAELYYWFTPKFALGLGHKATWARTDDLDGQQWDSNNELTAENDLYHYTHIGAKWIIDPARRQIAEPTITIIDPQTNPFASPTSEAYVRAEIKNASADQVTCRVNGRAARFNMNRENFTVNFPLREGSNEIVITAKNAAGQAEATQIITFQNTYTDPVQVGDKPFIAYTNPAERGAKTSQADFRIEAVVENVTSARDVQLSFNGSRISNFNFDQNGRLSAAVRLKEGRNDIRIKAKNNQGETTKDTNVYFGENTPAERTTVTITRPNTTPYTTDRSSERVEADITNINSKSDITFYVSGQRSSDFTYDQRTGRFRADVRLKEGYNKIVVEANGAGKASDSVTINYKRDVPPPPPPNTLARPNVRITSVSTPRASDCYSTVRATITNVSTFRDIAFKVNGQRVSNFEFNPNNGSFQCALNFKRGQNNIFLEARNASGRSSDSASANCSAATTGSTNPNTDNSTPTTGSSGKDPIVKITTPSKQSTTTNNEKATIKATIQHIDSKNDITFKVNGQRVTNFTYSANTDKFSANITLKSGNNDIIVRAVNKFGQDDATAAIRYIRQIGTPSVAKPPKVTITKPSNNATVTSPSTAVKATITNMPSKTGITLTVNGQNISNFAYSNKTLSATVNLKEGTNSIVVKAKNADGQDQKTVKVRYNAAKPKPTVTFTKPRNNTTVETARTEVTATVKNATKQDLIFTVNGQKVTSFTLSGTTFRSTVNLKKGLNNLQLKANNAGGSATANLAITYKEKVILPKPIVKITKPARSGGTTSNARATIEGTVKNVSQQKDITLKLNGNKITRFSFDAKTGVVKASVTLKEGKNTIELMANNTAGSARTDSSITYKKTVIKPTVVIESASEPTTNPLNPNVGRSSVIATIKNVPNKQGINFTVNGKKITNFEFNARTGFFKAIVDLERGDNAIKIQGTNAHGSASDSRVVKF